MLISRKFCRCIFACFCLVFVLPVAWSQDTDAPPPQTPLATPQDDTLATLQRFSKLRSDLRSRIKGVERQLQNSPSDSEKKQLQAELSSLEKDLEDLKDNFVEIAAGIGFAAISQKPDTSFNLQAEMLSLMEPVVREMKHMTSDVRKKSDLREKITFYEVRIPKAKVAVENVSALIEKTKDKTLRSYLEDTLDDWKRQLANMESELQAANFQLSRIESTETSFADASQSYLKSFFQQRGLYLIQALLVVGLVLLLSRLSRKLMMRMVPGYNKTHRSFQVRLLDLVHRLITVALTIIGPMVVFYYNEDWVLFSLGILLLLGAAWTLRTAVPRYWQQIRLYLNIGAVREGERVFYEGLPWSVKKIDIFTTLENPDAGISQRIAIENLVDLKSRPGRKDEPWFPCKKDDWVLLSDGVRGKVIGISHEFVELIERGGARKTYLTQDFLGQSPRNLSVNFRLKETIGISYDLQSDSTSTILQVLRDHLTKRIAAEGYNENLINIQVEFQMANTSSLDLVVIADFKGEVAPLYNRLRRAIQRWSVDACTENNWEIPFTQVTLHGHVQQ
ncbi:MAG: hypothetical protein KDI63_01650 [Gammaproteobacteria bacterium]|nr:hypothetical protein [Gammaproteobacteria bacterium]